MRVGLGDDTTDNADLNALYTQQQGTGLDAISQIQVGTPMPTNPLTGQPVSTTTAQNLNALSNNSTLIVALCAIGGLLLAITGKK